MLKLHPLTEQLVDYVQDKAQIDNREFFRTMITYYLGTLASTMRASIAGFNPNGLIPINIYAMCLSPSGSGKGVTQSTIENEIIKKFNKLFEHKTFPEYQAGNLEKIAEQRCRINGSSFDDEMAAIVKEVESSGKYLGSFEGGTAPAVKQYRHRLLLAGSGSLNYVVDEIGSNLIKNTEINTAFLDIYDLGLTKERLVKSTTDNKRFQHIDGNIPANMLLFGTPSAVFDGGSTEENFLKILEEGYARRCLFAFSKSPKKLSELTPEEVVDKMLAAHSKASVDDIAKELKLLADINNLHREILIERDEMVKLIQYKMECEKTASTFSEHNVLKKLEMEHRYFKALKLAGVYAFIDGDYKITENHLDYAINMVELSGKAFQELIQIDKPYMRLAKYFAEREGEVTYADLIEELPYFRGSKQQKEELISLAIAHGYRHNIIIKKSIEDGITFFSGEALKATDLDNLGLSISKDLAEGYKPTLVSWDKLDGLGKSNDFHWANHAFVDEHRREDNVIPGFNLLVLDVDNGFPLKAAIKAFEGVYALFYTTKRSTPNQERYRIVIPTSHELKLDKAEYKEFMSNVCRELPFEVDPSSLQRSKKWQTNKGTIVKTTGDLFNVLPYIPKTKKSDERREALDSQDLDRIETWVLNNTGNGSRNKQLFNYACILKDMGSSLLDIRTKVLSLNNKLADRLSEEEISNTIMKSIANKMDT